MADSAQLAAAVEVGEPWRPESHRHELSKDPMEFLSRSWSASALEVSKALAPPPLLLHSPVTTIPEDAAGEVEDPGAPVSCNSFSFASSATSQLVMERIMSQSDVSPPASGRPSHSSGPLNGGGSLSDSPPISPSDMDEIKNPSMITASRRVEIMLSLKIGDVALAQCLSVTTKLSTFLEERQTRLVRSFQHKN